MDAEHNSLFSIKTRSDVQYLTAQEKKLPQITGRF